MMRRLCWIAFVLILSLALSLCIFAADDGVISDSKDGLAAEMTVNYDSAAPESISVNLKVTNESADDVSNIVASLVIAGEFELNSGEQTTALTLPVGQSTELVYSIINRDAVGTVGSEPVTEPEKSGCGAALSGAAAIFALICSVFFTVKNPKRGTACMLVCFMLASVFALPSNAATTERRIVLEGTVNYNEKEYPITATVSYEHTFNEAEGVDTKGMEKFEITYYYGPQGTDLCNEEYIRMIAECGFTSVPIESSDPAINKTALALLKKYGMTCSGLHDPRIQQAITLAYSVASAEEIDSLVKQAVDDYKDFDNIKAWWLRDEPSASLFKALGVVVDSIKRIDPERDTLINLFPIYASEKQLGTSTYQQYLDNFIETVKPAYLSYDHYHFRKTQNRKDFFENLEIVRDTAIANELDPMLIILVTEHMGYQNLTKYQIEWEVNMCLTYGMKRVSYFTYWLGQELLAEGWSNAFMDTNGTVYQHYYDVQEINKWLLPLGTELFGKNSTAVFHVKSRGAGLEKGCEAYTSYGDLGEINASGFVIGFFDDGSFMITNKSYADTENARNTLEFIDVTDNLEYFDAASASWKDAESEGIVSRNENGNLHITFEPGEGMLFRVVD